MRQQAERSTALTVTQQLTDTESTVFHLMLKGTSNREIQSVAENAKTTMRRIYGKLSPEEHTRTALMRVVVSRYPEVLEGVAADLMVEYDLGGDLQWVVQALKRKAGIV